MKKYDEEIQKDLKCLLDHFRKEDQEVRNKQILQWRKLKLYWSGLQRVWYDEVAHDWRVWDEVEQYKNEDAAYYDKPVNIYRAYLESIIAALSINIPAIACIPDDPNNPMDVSTAKAGETIARLVYKQNDAVLFWLHALYIYCTEGLIACYTYSKEDEKYGTFEEDVIETTKEERYVCAECQKPLEDDIFKGIPPGGIFDELPPEEQPVIPCPECGAQLDPSMQKQETDVERIVGTKTTPKTKQCLEVFGGLYVKIPNYAMKQEDCPYLIWAYETHYSNVIEKYDELRDKIKGNPGDTTEHYEKWGRLSPQYRGDYPLNTMTVSNAWFRPSSFNVLEKERCEVLKKAFPKGVKVIFANELYCHAEPESMDDCWTLTHNPLSDYLHHDPLGLFLVSVQDITNDLVALTLQTIEQGIPQTFADPNVLDFNAYKNSEAAPGSVYPVKNQPAGKNLGESFVTLKASSLSNEVLPFGKSVQDLGQLVSGALPSLFGGMAEQGSKTASEYSMSRAQALQRLQTPWKMLTFWWKGIFDKVIKHYIEDMVEDEKYVTKGQSGNYLTTWIKKVETQGKIGSIELEPNENLPMTMQQKKDVLIQLMQFADPMLIQVLSAPENIPFMKEALGLEELVVPGEEDRQQQYEEIEALLESGPMPSMDMMTGMPIELPSVQIDPLLDNHQIGAEICRSWAISEVGRQTKIDNPPGYKNVLLHMKQHMDQVAMQMQQQQQMQAQSENGSEDGKSAQSEKTTITKERKGPPVGDNGNDDKQLPVH